MTLQQRVLRVEVKTRAAHASVMEQADGVVVVCVQSPPVDGKANAELVNLLARHFGVPRSCVQIKSGASSRHKRVSLTDG
jgi:uncharacterized protein